MNARNPMWGDTVTNEKGRIFEELIINNPQISLLNDNNPTHYHIQTNSYSVIDLSLCSADILLEFTYSISRSSYSSDHFPIILNINTPTIIAATPERFKTTKANWTQFRNLTNTALKANDFSNIKDAIEFIETTIIGAANATIPKTGNITSRPPVPWFNDECRRYRRNMLRAERALRRNYSVINAIAYKRARAQCRFIMNKARKQSWQSYVSTITSKLPLSSVWKRVAKISGKFRPSPTPVL